MLALELFFSCSAFTVESKSFCLLSERRPLRPSSSLRCISRSLRATRDLVLVVTVFLPAE